MKIAIAQLNSTIGDLNGNAKNILEAAKKADDLGANLLLTPELSLCGYPPRDLLLNPSFIETMATTLSELATNLPPNLSTLIGIAYPNNQAHINGGKPLFNSTAWLEAGKIKQIFHKRLLPTYDVFDEYRYFEPGLESNFLTINGVKIGVTICEDLWNNEEFWGKRSYAANPIADLAALDVDLIINLSASPYTVRKQQLREAMLSHSVQRYQLPIIYTNQIGANDDLIFDGNSFAMNQAREVVCRAAAFKTDLIMVEFDEQKGDLIPVNKGAESYFLVSNEEEEIWSALVLGVQDYARKCGFSKVVIGLSGGIDSALVAAIATAALGAENVLGVLMPSPYSSDHSVSDALELANNLSIKTHQLPIGNLMESYDHNLAEIFAGTEFGLAEENIQARIRGNLLMAIANKFGYLLLSTGNKSEMAVGYCTLYGDMNGGLAVIADVPKTRVYALCQWLNTSEMQNKSSKSVIIPEHILTKAPSAELKPDQFDQDSLPPYHILDEILYRLINEHQSAEEIIAAGHHSNIVNKVIKLVSRAEFKRRQAPPGLKITDRAFGSGWRMPIANHWIGISQF